MGEERVRAEPEVALGREAQRHGLDPRLRELEAVFARIERAEARLDLACGRHGLGCAAERDPELEELAYESGFQHALEAGFGPRLGREQGLGPAPQRLEMRRELAFRKLGQGPQQAPRDLVTDWREHGPERAEQ